MYYSCKPIQLVIYSPSSSYETATLVQVLSACKYCISPFLHVILEWKGSKLNIKQLQTTFNGTSISSDWPRKRDSQHRHNPLKFPLKIGVILTSDLFSHSKIECHPFLRLFFCGLESGLCCSVFINGVHQLLKVDCCHFISNILYLQKCITC